MAGKTLVTGPALEPVSLSEARAHCRVDSNEDDGLLQGYVLAARQYVEKACGRALISQSWKIAYDFKWPSFYDYDRHCYHQRIVIPLPPLISVSTITYLDTNGATQTLASNQYTVSTVGLRGAVEPAWGVAWPSVRSQIEAVNVTFSAGYGTTPGSIPEPIRQAILLLVSHWYDQRGVQVARISQELPYGVDALLEPYQAL